MKPKNNSLLSVVMCVYNGGKYIKECIQSVLNQSFKDFEFIIINDGSDDDTEKIIFSFHDDRIVYVKNEVNLKIIKSANKGIDIATGKYIARMDSDDIALPDRFEKQLKIFSLYPSIDIVNADAFFLEEDGLKFRKHKSSTVITNFESIRYLIYLQNFIYNPTVMVNSDLLKKYKYTDDNSNEHIEDYDLWIRMLRDGCICYTINEELVLYRDNSSSINHTYKSNQVKRISLLCRNLMLQDFDFNFDKDLFETLVYEFDQNLTYSYLVQLNNELLRYNEMIKSKALVTDYSFQDMEIWRKQKIILISFKSFKKINMLNMISVFYFLLSKLAWFFNRTIFSSFRRAIITHYWETSNFVKLT